MVNHVYGNTKIKILKNFKKLIEFSILFFLSFFYKFNKTQKIIIYSEMYAHWKNEKKFLNLFLKIKDLTIIDEARAYTLWYLSKSLKNIQGDIFDIGCMKGGAGILMSKANENKNTKTYFIDTFDGYAKSSGDHKKKVTFVYSKTDELIENLKIFKIKKYKVLKKRFPKKVSIKKKIKLCHLDINIYEDTVKSFIFVDKHLIKNGIIVFDDYGIFKVDGILKAIKKILKEKYDQKYHVIYNYMGQCIMIKK